MEIENEKQSIKIHYYFDDDSHSMDAFVRNKMEKEYLELFYEIGKKLGVELRVESKARNEGGLIENIDLVLNLKSVILGGLVFLAPSINKLFFYYLSQAHKKEKIEIQKLIRDMEKEDDAEKQKNSEFIKKTIEEIFEDPKFKKRLSNIYCSAEQYPKIKKIGYAINTENEFLVHREDFQSFIISEYERKINDSKAIIEIIAPVLRLGKSKWVGVYKGEKIDFAMDDLLFKEEIAEGLHNFQNGSSILCNLQIKETIDENSKHVIKRIYSVLDVEETIVGEIRRRINKKRIHHKTNLYKKNLLDLMEAEDGDSK